MSEITGSAHSGANSLECESSRLHMWRANSMTATCIPRQMPKNGSPRSRAQRIASTMPSTPRTPNPPGTSSPCTGPNNSAARSAEVNRSLEIQRMSTPTSLAMPPWISASWTLL